MKRNSQNLAMILSMCGFLAAAAQPCLGQSVEKTDTPQDAIRPRFVQDAAPSFAGLSEKLVSDNILQQQGGQEELAQVLTHAPDEKQAEILQHMLTGITDPNSPYSTRLGYAEALSQLGAMWRVPDLEAWQQKLYTAMLVESDPRMRLAVDQSLMNSSGLYRDAIASFNSNRYDESEARFNRIINEFPESHYAINAQFFLGQLPRRRCFMESSANCSELLKQSNNAFESLINRIVGAEGIEQCEYYLDAAYYRALNLIYLQNFGMANDSLDIIADQAEKRSFGEEFIYVYYFVDMPGAKVIDAFFPAKQLAEYTKEFLTSRGEEDFDYDEFAKYLNCFKPSQIQETNQEESLE